MEAKEQLSSDPALVKSTLKPRLARLLVAS
jgi:hypothetical protein